MTTGYDEARGLWFVIDSTTPEGDEVRSWFAREDDRDAYLLNPGGCCA